MRAFDLVRVLCSCSTAFALAACAESAAPAAPPRPPADAPPSGIPRQVAGTYAVSSELDLPLPGPAEAAIAPLVAATDGPDDPSRWVLDRLVDQIPESTARTIARDAVPLLASYLNARLADVAPHLASGLDQLAHGLERIARHVGTVETWQVDARGDATRIISGVRFDAGGTPVELRFADHGLDDRSALTHLTLDPTGHLAVADHRLLLGYGAVLRLGFDHAVIPSVDPAASDLATALADLADCQQLGDFLYDELGIGSPALYRAACLAATVAVADDVYARISAIDAEAPLSLELEGTAQGVDRDGDGTMDEVRAGSWTGVLDPAGSLGLATFSGSRAR